MKEVLYQIYWGNTVLAYLIALGGVVLAWLILRLLRGQLIRLLRKITSRTNSYYDDLFVTAAEKFLLPLAYLSVNYSILLQLNLHPRFSRILDVAMMVVTSWFVIRLINFLLHGMVQAAMQRRREPPERLRQLNGILLIVKIIIWAAGLIMLVDNLGYDVTTIIAGLGVGGIAIALAAQNILGDLFSYLVIFFDKPFEVGDFIVVGNNSGIVEKIGIKTSHVRSLDGQQLVMPNAEMVKTVIHNYKRLQRRRVVFIINVTYQTDAESLRDIPSMIKAIIAQQKDTSFDRAHLKSLGESSIQYEIVYYVESADYIKFMDAHHAVSLGIFQRFAEEGIAFAHPASMIYLQGEGVRA
jgi:small-conductance mechanosensitive channel